MDKSKNKLDEESTEKLHNNEIFLIVSIDKKEKITQFNKECEKITGYTRYEALNKDFFEFLIPTRYSNIWRRMLNLARQNEVINNLKLPWLTKHKDEVMIQWSSFPAEEVDGDIGGICLVGKLIIPNIDEKRLLLENKKEVTEDKKSIIEFIKAGLENNVDVVDKSSMERYNKDEKVFNLGKNRVIFKNIVSTSSKNNFQTDKKKTPSQIKEKKTTIKPKPEQTVKEEKTEESLKLSIESHRSLDRIIKELEKKNKRLEKENKILEKIWKLLNFVYQAKKNQKSQLCLILQVMRLKKMNLRA